MTSFKLSEVAKEDLIRIYQFGVKAFGEKQANRYYNSFFECFIEISKRPKSYESVDYIRKGYRRCVCGVDSIYFRENSNYVEIMAIIGRQELSNIT